MKLATLPNGTRDGALHVVSGDLTKATPAAAIAPTLQAALEDWDRVEPALRTLADRLEQGQTPTIAFDESRALSPLPRSYQWLDGSCFKNHLKLMSMAFGRDPKLEMESSFPLVYQGMSDNFYPPHGDIVLPREEDGIDFEAEVGVIVGDIPMGTLASEAAPFIRLITLINDVSLRGFVPREIQIGFGWINAKPSTAFAPVAVTPDELGAAWTGKVNLPISVKWNDTTFGTPDASEMSFSFYDLIEHITRTRKVGAGTIVGSGTVSNFNYSNVGSACIAERRAIEMIESGKPKTEFMKFGDHVRIEMAGRDGRSIFGAIDQKVVRYSR
jgi:fumarylacetoacetate (FAA) hydrolase